MAGMYIYQQMAGASEEYLDNSQVNGNANGNGHHAGDGRTHYLEVEGVPTDKLRILFKGHTKGYDEPEEITDEPYWADLSPAQRRSFYRKDIGGEISREVRSVFSIFRRDPLEPFRIYTREYIMTGIGLFLEGYVIFSISNVTVLFNQSHGYYNCFKTYTSCNKTWTQATTYLQLVGILIGQLFFGFAGDWIGRKFAMLADMFIILLGVIMLTVSNGKTIQGWLIMYAISQLTFGIGIGGEYPQTSTRATEESATNHARGQRHRGRKVMLSYTMQGWGQLVNLGVLMLLLLIFNSTANPPPKTKANPNRLYSEAAMGAVWRTSFGLLIPVVLYIIYYRIWVLKELQFLNNDKKRNNIKGYDWHSFGLLITYFWHRLFGTAGIWFCNDWYFYGNGVFRSTFVSILLGKNASIFNNWLWSFLNAGIQLFGYYFAALSVDMKPWGRRRMTTVSFMMVAIIFLICAAAFNHLTQPAHIQWFQALYYLSSFFGLFGSHTTSFLLSAESYPTSVRSTAHGISAAAGKVGSIGVVVWFNYATTNGKYWIAWPVALIGALITWFFIADTTGLDLNEGERRWAYIRAGRSQDYHGPAVHPRHLSIWEKWVCSYHKQYNPELDREQRRLAQKAGYDRLSVFTLDMPGADGKLAHGDGI